MITNTTSLQPDKKMPKIMQRARAVHRKHTFEAASQTIEGLQPGASRRRDLHSYHYYGFESKVHPHRSRTLWPGQP